MNKPQQAGVDCEEGLSEVLERGGSEVAILGQLHRELGLVSVVSKLEFFDGRESSVGEHTTEMMCDAQIVEPLEVELK